MKKWERKILILHQQVALGHLSQDRADRQISRLTRQIADGAYAYPPDACGFRGERNCCW